MPFLSSRIAALIFVPTTLIFAAPQNIAGGSVVAECRGEWVPALILFVTSAQIVLEYKP